MSLEFRISGIVFERDSRRPIPNLIIRAYDKDLLFDDLLGQALSDESGRFELHYTERDFRDLFEKKPDVYFRVFDFTGTRFIHLTTTKVRWDVGVSEFFEIAIPSYKLPLPLEDIILMNTNGTILDKFEVGDSLVVHIKNLPSNRSCALRILTERDKEVLSASLISNRYGIILPTVLWPDIGIGIPDKGGHFASASYEKALEILGGLSFTLEIRVKGKLLGTKSFSITDKMVRPRIFPVSKDGYLQRGLLLGRDEIRVRGMNFAPRSQLLVFLVPRQYNWHTDDPIIPIRNFDGSEIVTRVRLDRNETSFTTTLWSQDQLRPGSYDIIVRRIFDHEYLSHERVLRSTDFVSERLMTTLVVRDNIYHIKAVLMGCVNSIEIAGRRLPSSPYFKFTNNFPVGTDVYAALDPAGLMPEAIGKKVRYYVVNHKNAAQWSADSILADVTGTVSEIIASSSCINFNKSLVWSNPQQPGKYDLIADFGNNDPNPQNFASDDSFDPPLDMIDGYFKVGFHVTEDPSVEGKYKVGRTSYDEPAVEIPAVGVWCPFYADGIAGETSSGTLDLPIRAIVRYPADSPGDDVPVSDDEVSYPLVVIMHGMHTIADPSYLGYNFLLDHLASHGFIAVSIDCNAINAIQGMQDTRAHAILEHIAYLESLNSSPGLFQGKIDFTRIAIMGHSRGGDGVVQAEVFNQTLGLGKKIKAVIALAPTDFSGTGSDPLILNSSKFLCIYGSNDGDVWGGYPPATQYTGTGFRFYDRATVEKAMVFIYGATHNRFNREWTTEGKVDTSSVEVPSRDQHEVLLCGYMTAFLQVHLLNRPEQIDYFTGELRIPQVDEIEVHTQYHPPSSDCFTLDSFETAPQITQSSSGGQINHANFDGIPEEDMMGNLDLHSPHQTRGLKLKWNSLTATYQSELPLAGPSDVSGFNFLSFRVSQTASNPVDQLQDFYVRLNTAGGGNSRAVRVGYFGSIPFPDKPEYILSYDSDESNNTKSALKTIRIPLHAWTIKAMSAPIVDLTNIESITFEFKLKPTGEILVDDIEFTI